MFIVIYASMWSSCLMSPTRNETACINTLNELPAAPMSARQDGSRCSATATPCTDTRERHKTLIIPWSNPNACVDPISFSRLSSPTHMAVTRGGKQEVVWLTNLGSHEGQPSLSHRPENQPKHQDKRRSLKQGTLQEERAL